MPGSGFVAGRVAVRNGHLAFHRSSPKQQTLLFLHGLGDNGLCWLRVAHDLAVDYEVILLDSRGHGESAMPPDRSADDPAGDLLDLLDQLAVARVVIVGHSIGALSAAAFTAKHNDRVIKLVIEDPPLRDKPFHVTDKMRSGFVGQMSKLQAMSLEEAISFGKFQHPKWDDSEFDAWARAKRQVNPEIIARYAFPGWQDLVAGIAVPSLLIRGEPGSDSAVSERHAGELLALNANFKETVVSGAGHNVRRENFEEYVTVLRRFLNQ